MKLHIVEKGKPGIIDTKKFLLPFFNENRASIKDFHETEQYKKIDDAHKIEAGEVILYTNRSWESLGIIPFREMLVVKKENSTLIKSGMYSKGVYYSNETKQMIKYLENNVLFDLSFPNGFVLDNFFIKSFFVLNKKFFFNKDIYNP